MQTVELSTTAKARAKARSKEDHPMGDVVSPTPTPATATPATVTEPAAEEAEKGACPFLLYFWRRAARVRWPCVCVGLGSRSTLCLCTGLLGAFVIPSVGRACACWH